MTTASFNAPERDPESIPIPDRIDAGMRLLATRRAPHRALDRVDTTSLDMGSAEDDVLAHIWGKYLYGFHALDLTHDLAVALGFDAAEGETDHLTAMWVERIEAQRAAEAACARQVEGVAA